jgi:hypothetical protein
MDVNSDKFAPDGRASQLCATGATGGKCNICVCCSVSVSKATAIILIPSSDWLKRA